MTRESILIALGILVALTPYSGLPLSLLAIVLPVLGLLIAAIGATLRVRKRGTRSDVVTVYESTEV